ncbi:hypothetical protein HZ326_3642 [Fusarium oxysporum f. sp. albedinis]|nr:hypothetical protein HZ326_3642 [Fusarium oxysporum f. sp. albedinis]
MASVHWWFCEKYLVDPVVSILQVESKAKALVPLRAGCNRRRLDRGFFGTEKTVAIPKALISRGSSVEGSMWTCYD